MCVPEMIRVFYFFPMMRKWKTAVRYFHGSWKWWALSCTFEHGYSLKTLLKSAYRKGMYIHQWTACWLYNWTHTHLIRTQSSKPFRVPWNPSIPLPLFTSSPYRIPPLWTAWITCAHCCAFYASNDAKRRKQASGTIEWCSFMFTCGSPSWCPRITVTSWRFIFHQCVVFRCVNIPPSPFPCCGDFRYFQC